MRARFKRGDFAARVGCAQSCCNDGNDTEQCRRPQRGRFSQSSLFPCKQCRRGDLAGGFDCRSTKETWCSACPRWMRRTPRFNIATVSELLDADLPIARLEVAIATRQHPLRTEPLAQYSSAARSKSNEVIHRCRRWRTPPKHEPFTTLDVPFRTPLAISQRPRLGQKTRSFRSP